MKWLRWCADIFCVAARSAGNDSPRCDPHSRRPLHARKRLPPTAAPLSAQPEARMIGEDTLTAQAETEHLREQLLRAQRLSSVGTLASSVAHEFNNILTTLINYAKLGLKPDCSEASKQQAFEKILKGSQRAALIISSMLGFARNHSTRRELADLIALVEEVLVLTEKDLSKHQIQIEKRYTGKLVAPVVRGQIEQILLNLIINARQAMPRGGRLTNDVRSNAKTKMAEVCVCDTGVGIPPEQLRLIFEPFYTTKTPDRNGHGGSGLGLSVCRQIIEQHQGRIRVESVVGKGSKFIVKLPLDTPHEPAA
jgi:signal transduction histidine kinase